MAKRKRKRMLAKPNGPSDREMRDRLAVDPKHADLVRDFDIEEATRDGMDRHFRTELDGIRRMPDLGAIAPGEMLHTTFRDEFKRFSSPGNDAANRNAVRSLDAAQSLRRAMAMAKADGGGEEGSSIWGRGGFDARVGRAIGLTDRDMPLERAIRLMDAAVLEKHIDPERMADFIQARAMLDGDAEEHEKGVAIGLEIVLEGYRHARDELARLKGERTALEGEYQSALGQLMAVEALAEASGNGGRLRRMTELDVLIALGLR